jgi:hypothetical protein
MQAAEQQALSERASEQAAELQGFAVRTAEIQEQYFLGVHFEQALVSVQELERNLFSLKSG